MDDIRCVLDQAHLTWGNQAQALIDGFWMDFAAEMRSKSKKSKSASQTH